MSNRQYKRNVGIYVQVPFCQTKCTYCNFHTGVVSSARFAPYIAAVCSEIAAHRELYAASGVNLPPSLAHPEADTVYIGGGTPSLLDPQHLAALLDAIRHNFDSANSGGSNEEADASASVSATRQASLVEVTLEADPETVTDDKAAAWLRAGINRVSFGVQSFSDRELAAAGRMHRRADVYRAADALRNAGFRNISFDLIAGLPHQTRESWQQSLNKLAALAPEHVSIYLLEIDEGSHLGKEVLQGGRRYSAASLPSEDEMAGFYETACEFLAARGYRHYEISNWAKPGFESRHNLKYWRREPYLGFGAGAHSFSGIERWANAHDAAAYVSALQSRRLPIEQLEILSAQQALDEELFLGLRQLDGIDLARIEHQYGIALGAKFDSLASAGLIQRDGAHVRLAPEKLSVSNEVFVELLNVDSAPASRSL